MALFDIFGGGNPTTDFTDAPSEADRKRALNMALMQAGAAILANNRGNYGALAPALGAGIQNGLLSYNYNYEKGQQAAAKRKQLEMQKKLFSESMQGGQFNPSTFVSSALQNPEAGYADTVLPSLLKGSDNPFGKIMPGDFTPESLGKYEQSRKFSDLVPNQNSIYGKYNPGQYTPESWAKFVGIKDPSVLERYATPQVIDAGGSKDIYSMSGGTPKSLKSIPVTPKPGEMPAFQAAQETAKGEAKTGVERMAEAPKIKARIVSQDAKYKNLETTIDKALKNSGFWSTGVMAQMLSGVGGTTAKNLAATLDTVKANMGFDELQEMRNNSPTGGALGQVAVQEIQYLQSVIASLDQAQSSEQLKSNLESIKRAKRESNARIRKAYEETYGNKQGSKPAIQELW